jgi:hypothetical protein
MMRLGIALVLAMAAAALPARAENRLANPEFDDALQLDGWHETGVWATADYLDSPTSGSVRVVNALPTGTTVLARQCVAPVNPGYTVDGSVYARATAGQSAGSVLFAVVFWRVADCIAVTDEDAVGYFASPQAPQTGAWVPLSLSDLSAPPLTQAAEIQLIVSTSAGGSLAADFDHAFLPEPDSVLSASAALLALAAHRLRVRHTMPKRRIFL